MMAAAVHSLSLAMAVVALAVGSCTSINPAPITQLEGTSWRVVMVNGRQTPAQGDYSMRFDSSGGVGARFGCNHMGGNYRLVGATLTISDLASTLMGCPEPAGTFEAEASAILSRPMQVSFTSNDRMGLSNEAGSISLDPMP